MKYSTYALLMSHEHNLLKISSMDSPMKQTSNMDSSMKSFGDHDEIKTDKVSVKNSF